MECKRVFLSMYMPVMVSLISTTVSCCTDCDGDNVTCFRGVCLSRCVNVTSSGECLQCRDSRFYGQQCENVCPHTCLNSRCQLGGSHAVCTEGCVTGKKGDNCGVDCPGGCTQCERYSDSCVGPCSSSYYYGERCDKPCPSNCKEGCNRTGVCDYCAAGYRGGSCNRPCSSTCKQCERYSDRCVGLCASSQYYGDHCDKVCSNNCEDGCNRVTGMCNSCKTGQTGTYCNETCLGGCENGIISKTIASRNDTLIAVGCALLSIAVTGGLLFMILLLWRKRLKKLTHDEQMPDNGVLNNESQILSDKYGNLISSPKCYINLTYGLIKDQELKFVTYCDDFLTEESEMNVDYIMNEFSNLPPPNSGFVECASHGDNLSKNRYRDVLPFDQTRVFLETDDSEEPDYINASYINGYRNQIRYVAAQGPSLQVIDDFWRMIWQLNTTKIVMLTNLVEAEKVKCEMYWPFCSSESQSYGKVCVQCMEEKVYQYYTLRKLAVWKGKSETRVVRQFHFTAWPDHGVPEDTKSIIDFHRVVKDTGPNALGLMVVHCSAGVGRSGTFIALDYLLDQARYEGSVCIFKSLQEFRLQRMKMVQTKEQYKFVYDLLASVLQHRGTMLRYYSPVLLQCEMCWNKKHKAESREDEDNMDEEYEQLWKTSSEGRDRFLPVKPPSDACAIISEESPPLLMSPIEMKLDSESDNEMEKQRISWVTVL